MDVQQALEDAEKIFQTFYKRCHKTRKTLNFTWPEILIEAGSAEAQLYRSNKWESDLKKFNDYKHRAEAPQNLMVVPGVKLEDENGNLIKFYGTKRKQKLFPSKIAVLGNLLGLQVNLNNSKGIREGDKRLYEFRIQGAKLAAAIDPETRQTLLIIYTEKSGICFIIYGDELEIEPEGIVG